MASCGTSRATPFSKTSRDFLYAQIVIRDSPSDKQLETNITRQSYLYSGKLCQTASRLEKTYATFIRVSALCSLSQVRILFEINSVKLIL